MAITFPATTLADGALFSKTWVDMVIDDINHLSARPRGFLGATGTGQTATSGTFTQLTTPTVTITPRKSGFIFVIGTLAVTGSVAGDTVQARLNVNGTTGGTNAGNIISLSHFLTFTLISLFAVTAGTAYTARLEFNRSVGTGTITANSVATNYLLAIEVG